MAIKIGHASSDENSRASGGKAGDQTGKEVCIRTWYSSPWDLVLRCKDSKKAELMARACEAACKNDKIGYDQSQRNSLNDEAKKVNYDLALIKTACECDCSSLMTVCAQAAGINVPYVYGNAPYTGNMRTQFMTTGFFDALTSNDLLRTDMYLKRGDILVRTSGHTAMALENGSRSSACSASVSLYELQRGSNGSLVEAMQTLINLRGIVCDKDGEFGPSTEASLRNFQKKFGLTADGICGTKTWEKLLKG